MIAQAAGAGEALLTIFFVLFYVGVFGLTFGGMILAVCAIVSAARLPPEAFGPWWDNTKTAWLIGIAVGFLVPCGSLVTGFYWFNTGRRSRTRTGLVARPFWVGPPKPPPPQYWPPIPPTPPPPTTTT